jgi:hypothetical protein
MKYDPFINKLAKAMAGYIYSNGIVEEYHESGCLNNEQIKAINKYMVDRLGYALHLLTTEQSDDLSLLLGLHYTTCKMWDDVDYSVGEGELAQLKRTLKE